MRAWLLLATVGAAEGRLGEGCAAWRRAEAARRAAHGAVLISGYEVELFRWDARRGALLASACGGSQ